METYLRGFSFMPEDAKVEVIDLQYIEGKELERAWKTNRRQRLKDQEQKIWDEFVQEQDVVKTLYKSDPYQFLHELDEGAIKDMLETELQKMRRSKQSPVSSTAVVEPQGGEGDSRPPDEVHVTFEDDDKEECDMFHIFDDELSGPEDEVMVESSPPSSPAAPLTVRAADSSAGERPHTDTKSDIALSSKSSENVTNSIENSIYCARVKDLRIRINDEVIDSINTLEKLEVLSLERESAARAKRRAKEFCSRFQTQKLYPLQKQLSDIQRVVRHPAPFGKHTQFQSLMVRVVSLHQNLLMAYQVLLRNYDQTYWLVQSGDCVKMLIDFTKKGAQLHQLDQDLMSSCDKLAEAFSKYTTHVTNFFYTGSLHSSKKSKGRRRMRQVSNRSNKSGQGSTALLSMYSADTLRAKPSCSRENNATISKTKMLGNALKEKRECSPKSNRKSPRFSTSPDLCNKKTTIRVCNSSRRPLMRAPGGVASSSRTIQPKDAEVSTLVEAVGTCLSSHISPTGSTRTPRTFRSPKTRQDGKNIPTPRQKLPFFSSPKTKSRRSLSPTKPKKILKALSSIQSDPQDPESIIPSFNPITGQIDIPAHNIDKKQIDTKEYNIDKKQIDVKEYNIDKKQIDSDKKIFNNVDRNKNIDSKNPRKDNTKDGSERTKLSNDLKIDLRLKLDETEIDVMDKIDEAGNEDVSDRKSKRDSERSERSSRSTNVAARCEVTRLLKQLCSVEASGSKSERVCGTKNAQLVYVTGGSPRPPSTPQLLKILEETIQKKVPKSMYKSKKTSTLDPEKYRLTFNIAEPTANNLFQYRTRFVQHMLASAMYANSAVGKPWEMIGSVSEQILDDVIMTLTKEIQIKDIIQELYQYEINSD